MTLLAHHARYLIEIAPARIHEVAPRVARVFAVFANDGDGIHGESGPTAAQSFGDTGIDPDAMFFRLFTRQIVRGKLIHVERNDIEARVMPGMIQTIAIQQPAYEYIRVGVREVSVENTCHARFSAGSAQRRRVRGKSARGEKTTASKQGHVLQFKTGCHRGGVPWAAVTESPRPRRPRAPLPDPDRVRRKPVAPRSNSSRMRAGSPARSAAIKGSCASTTVVKRCNPWLRMMLMKATSGTLTSSRMQHNISLPEHCHR